MAMTLRLNDEHEQALALLASLDGVSKHEAILQAVLEAAARRARAGQVEHLSAQGRERYAALLDRLAQ